MSQSKSDYKPAKLANGIEVLHLNIFPSHRGATGVCKTVRHWCFCVITKSGRRHTDQGHASKKAAMAYIEKHSPDWA